MNKKALFVCFLFIFFIFKVSAQTVNFPIHNFSPKDYGKLGGPQNWCIAEDKSGVMYFGNASGILQYDAKNWRFIPVKYGSHVTSIAIDSSGTIFAGTIGNFGMLVANHRGDLIYQSLSDSLKELESNFGLIVKTYTLGKDVIFQSQEKLFIYNKSKGIKVINTNTSFHTSFVVNNEFYVRQREVGLLKLKQDHLEKVTGTEIFANDGIFAMLPYNNQCILIATMELGIFIYDPNDTKDQLSVLKTSDEKFILASQIYGGIKLSDGNYALNTINSGVIVMNKNGVIISRINREMGLKVDDVKQIHEDKQNNLWLGLNNGIGKVAYSSALSYYSDESGLTGSINSILRINEYLYIATSQGLFYINTKTSSGKFNRIDGVKPNQIWDLKEQNGTLIAAGVDGIFLVKSSSAIKISSSKTRSIVFDPGNNLWLTGDETGITIFDNDWKYIKTINPGMDVISLKLNRSSLLNDKTEIWAGSSTQGTTRILIDLALDVKIDWMGFPKGISNECIYPFEFENNVVFGSTNGTYSFDEKMQNKDGGFVKIGFGNNSISPSNLSILSQSGDKVWMSLSNKISVYDLKTDKSIEKPFLSIDKGHLYCIYPDSNITWIGADDGLIRYDGLKHKEYNRKYALLLRKVTCSNDSVLFNGNAQIERNDEKNHHLSYAYNSITFEYSGIFFEETSKNVYSHKLIGQDTAWTKWSNESKAVFTNLHEGEYEFLVRSKNVFGTESNIARFTFTIIAPWYRTWWAYASYSISFILILLGFNKIRTQKLKEEKIKLEAIVKERTAEVVKQKDEIAKQKHLVDEQHKEITDSINYAQRIQHSMLASDKLLNENLKDYFIFFKPKDVVSGDFYWATVLPDNKFALVTADSTGHGVPGAIMSILNISCLNDSIEAEKMIEPADILNSTRKRIIKHLSNDGSAEGGKDGMDCSLVSFDFKNNKLTYAAANNPVWIIRINAHENDISKTELIELPPDKMPVGKHDRDNVPFKQNIVDLQKGDIVYTFTDGMPDQFGGPKAKKFMYKKLAELFKHIHSLPMKEQKELIFKSFNEWKGDLEQVDDVCVIGVRI